MSCLIFLERIYSLSLRSRGKNYTFPNLLNSLKQCKENNIYPASVFVCNEKIN